MKKTKVKNLEAMKSWVKEHCNDNSQRRVKHYAEAYFNSWEKAEKDITTYWEIEYTDTDSGQKEVGKFYFVNDNSKETIHTYG